MAVAPMRDYMAPFNDGVDLGYKRAQQGAVRNAYTSGDPEALVRAGDVDGANALSNRTRTIRQQGAQDQMVQRLAARDFAGARQTPGITPEMLDQIDKADEQTKARLGEDASEAYSVAAKLAIIPADQRTAAFQRILPVLQQRFPNEDLSTFPLDDAGLKTKLETYDIIRKRANPEFKGVGGSLAEIGGDGSVKWLQPPASPGKPEWKERTNPDGSTEWFQLPPAGGAPPTPRQAPAPAPGDPAGGNVPRGLRNNNPLNLRPLGNGQWAGQTGTDGGNYAQFGSEQDGWNAAHKNLEAYGTKYGINTIAGVINRWAPAGDNNDPNSYAATVAKKVGIDPNAPIDLRNPQVREKLLGAMAEVELGQSYRPGQGSQPQPAAGGPPVIKGSAPKPKDERPMTEGQRKTFELSLRRDFTEKPQVKAFQVVRNAHNVVQSLVGKPPTAAGDVALIYAVMKTYDPNSVVRETEFGTAQNADSLYGQAMNSLNKVQNGQRLNAKQRAEMMQAVETVYTAGRQQIDALSTEYRGVAERSGVDPRNVIVGVPADEKPKPAPAALGGRSPLKATVETAKKGGQARVGGQPARPTSNAGQSIKTPFGVATVRAK